MTSIADKVLALHAALDDSGLAHAFGGALALAWCTKRPRGTSDIDLTVFVPADEARSALGALPDDVAWSDDDIARIERDGQVRVWWDQTPIDLFLNTTEFHEMVSRRCSHEVFGGTPMPFLACSDLAVFKAFFDRSRDWADLEEMLSAGTLDVEAVAGVLTEHLGARDERITRLRKLADRI